MKERSRQVKLIGWSAFIFITIVCLSFFKAEPQPVHDEGIAVPSIVEGRELYVEAAVLAEQLNGHTAFQSIDRALSLTIDNQHFFFIEGVPVVDNNGHYKPIRQHDFLVKENKAYLAGSWLQQFFPESISIGEGRVTVTAEESKAQNTAVVQAATKNEQEIIEQLAVLSSPLQGIKPDLYPSHIPGAKRLYRGGVHEGLDWYSYSTGAVINDRTPVYGMGEGTVVRVDRQYEGYKSAGEREEDLRLCRIHEKTPLYILDKLRGRQVWVQYENGVQARFAHLSSISKDLEVGSTVTRDTFIGFVGNSGTSGEVKKDGTEMHLHVDLLVKGRLFWEGLTKEEVTHIIKTVF
jgi:murein DD-endopeptidase MepM/ murein hydrolase activator NlpD